MPRLFRRATARREPLWRRYLRLARPDVRADIDDELRFHLESSTEELVRLGHSREEAELLSRERFGDAGAVRHWLEHHDRHRQRVEQRTEVMDSLLLDVRHAARRLRLQRGFTLSAVLVLGLGIGAATVMFSAVDAALLRPLPFQRDDRLVTLDGINIPVREFTAPVHSADINDVRARRDYFAHVAAYAPGGMNLSDVNVPVRLKVALVTPDLFVTLGVPVARGRGFTAEEGRPDGPHVLVLSDALWRRELGSDSGVVGRDLRLNDVPYRVIGVMPPGFRFPEETQAWLPLTVPSTFAQFEAFRSFMPSTVVARLAPGVTVKGAEAATTTLMRSFQDAARRAEPLQAPVVQPLRDALVGTRRTGLLVLMGATALVLLVACANVTNLLLTRAISQRGELALRAALGASRGRIVRQLLVESVLLSLAAGAVGVLLAYGGTGVLGALMPPGLAGTAPARVDARVLGFSLAIALVTGVVSGLWPAMGASRADAGETIKRSGAAGTTGREGSWMRRAFVVTELALALMLAVGSGLMLRSLRVLVDSDPGVRPASVATLELTLASASYPMARDKRRFFQAVMDQVRAVPGVEHAAAINELPLRGKSSVSVTVQAEGRPRAPGEERVYAQLLHTSPDYFATLGIPLLGGRVFTTPYDTARPPEVIVNERMAKVLWPGEDAVGKRLTSLFGGTPPVVVGVVGDVRDGSLESGPVPQMYLPLARYPSANAALVVRGALEPAVLAARLRDAVHAVDPSQAVYNVRPMTEVISGAIAPRRASTFLITLFGVVAVGLAAIGVYGVIALGVTRRAREIGIRVALGARPANVVRLVMREGLVLALLGVSLGLGGAWALRKVLAGLLYGVAPGDPLSFAGAAAVLLVVSVAAMLVPARIALRVDPAQAMRSE